MRRTQQPVDTLNVQMSDLRERLSRLEAETKDAHLGEPDGAKATARSLRRANARRASRRRAEARTLKADTRASIVDFVAKHPGATAGDVAKGLDLNRSSVSSRLTQLAKLGRVRKASRGYASP